MSAPDRAGLIQRFSRARTMLSGVEHSVHVSLTADDKVQMTLRSYEGVAREVHRLRRLLRDTPATREMLTEIQEELDTSLDDPNRVRLVYLDTDGVTDTGHAVLDIIEKHTGALP